jgi:glycosyltransferase involved in cell wall biosynthesis
MSQPNPQFVSLTDIPTPYRNHFYTTLHRVLQTHGLESSVWFMNWTERRRNWQFTQHDLPPNATVMPGWSPYVRNQPLPINPTVISRLLQHPPRYLLLSGGWFYPTNQLVTFLTRLTSTKVIFWNESNLEYMENQRGIPHHWRKWTMRQFEAFVVPGQMAQRYVESHIADKNHPPIFRMPNIVNEGRFCDEVARLTTCREDLLLKWQLHQVQRPICLIVARLAPIKGIDRLLQALLSESDILPNMTLLIAGDGPQRDELEQMISKANSVCDIRLLGYVEESTLLELLAIADAFVLPSIGDPYPLSAIEAAFAGLPLLLSNRVGCHPELLQAQTNGFLFDPYDADSIRSTFRKFNQSPSEVWNQMGQQSLKISQERFATDIVVNQFVCDVLTL